MTPNARKKAEEIALKISQGRYYVEVRSDRDKEKAMVNGLIELIAQALEEAYREGINSINTLCEVMDQRPIKSEAFKDGASQGFKAGATAMRERAAKVCELDPEGSKIGCYHCDCHNEKPQEYYPPLIRSLPILPEGEAKA